jgi:putative addiction module component (TIGR02574 family)
MDLTPTLQAIRAMSIEDRIRLVEVVWDEIAADSAFPGLTDAQKQELDRRLADADANPDENISWEVIREEARQRSRK